MSASCGKGDGPREAPVCRTYPTKWRASTTSGAERFSESCSWDASELELRCAQRREGQDFVWTSASRRTFPSVADFIAEGAFGVLKAATESEEGHGSKCCKSKDERVWDFDADGRPAASHFRATYGYVDTKEIAYDLVYGAWDGMLRPTGGWISVPACGYSRPFTLSYDDSTAKVVAKLTEPPAESCGATSLTTDNALGVGRRPLPGFRSFVDVSVETTETICIP